MTTHNQLYRSAPEAQGIPSSAILAFVEAVEKNIDSLHSFMLLRHGRVVAEGWWSPYAPAYPHVLFSLSKSFTSTAVGFAVAEGRLSVDDPVLRFFPDDAPAQVGENLAQMRVRHLLSMSTGHAMDTTGALFESPDGNWVRAFLAQPVEYTPGTHFLYNTGATYMLSAIVHKLAGMRLLDYLQPRLFDPLGITGATWEQCPRGIDTGGFGLSVKTEDIARFGQLYLQKGMWNGVRLLPEAWIEEATSKQVSNGSKEDSDWEQGYGYQFWRCRHNIYRGDGAFGQYCIVMPEQDAVLAITSGLGDMQAPLNLVWDILLPAMRPDALPEDRAGCEGLSDKLAGLVLPVVQGQPQSPTASSVSGKVFAFEPDEPAEPNRLGEPKPESVSVDFTTDQPVFTVRDARGEKQIVCGYGQWVEGTVTRNDEGPLSGAGPQRIAASGAWTADDTYTVKVCYTETPFVVTWTCQFADGQVTLNCKQNVGFGPTELPPLVGRAA